MIGNRPLRLWIAALALGGATSSRAAEPVAPAADLLVREWHRDSGLPSEAVYDIAQDRDGYLWLGTMAGLVRFDGREFRLYLPPEGPDGARPSFVFVFAESDGLWLVPRTGTPMRFRGGTFAVDPLAAVVDGATVLDAAVAADGAHWLALRGQGLVRRRAGAIERFGAADGLSVEGAVRFARDSRGREWISNDRRLWRYEAGRLVAAGLRGPVSEVRVVSSARGGPWVVTSNDVLKLDDADAPQLVAHVPPLLGAHYLGAAAEDEAGALWLGTRSQGLYRVSGDGVQHVPTSHESVTGLHVDSAGELWVGTNAGGLDCVGPKIHRLYDKSAGLLENAAYAVTEAADGAIWCANGDGGAARIHGAEVIAAPHRVPWPSVGVVGIAANPAGGIWLSTSSRVLALSESLTTPPAAVPGLPVAGARRMFVAADRTLWLSLPPTEVVHWSERAGVTTYGPEQGVRGGEVRCFAQDRGGAIWAGASNGTVWRWAGARFDRVSLPLPASTGAINAILFAPGGSLWLATARAGIVVVERGAARVLDAAVGLPDNNVTQLVADDHGYVWCGCGSGVFRLSSAEVEKFAAREVPAVNPLLLGRDEGLRNLTCAGIYFPGALKARDGRIWFATRQGVLRVDPAAPLLRARPQRVRIEELTWGTATVPASATVNVPAEARKLQLRFSVLALAAPHRVRTEYRLDGFDADWVVASAGSTATYPRLRPGRYTFRVRAEAGAPQDDSPADAIELVVPARWWEAPWFVIVTTLAGLAAVAFGAKVWATRRLRRRLRDLERERAVERERARIAQNIHDDIGASLTHISLLTQAAVAENSPEKLNRIYEATRDITRSLDEIVWAVNPQNDGLESFAEYLSSNAQRFLQAAGLRCRLELPSQLPAVALTSQARHHLFLCCREALHNVVKHAGATAVTIRLVATPEALTLTITDDGRGFAVTAARAPVRPGGGNGLRNLRDRMAELGGTCEIGSAPSGHGTSVVLHLPFR